MNIRIELLERDNDLLKCAYKVFLCKKISNNLLKKIFEKKENYAITPVNFEDSSKPEDKPTKFIIIIVIQPKNDGKKRNKINLIIDYLMFIRDKFSYQIEILNNY